MNFRTLGVIQVIETVVEEGAGVRGDPSALVTYYHNEEGELLCVNDPRKSLPLNVCDVCGRESDQIKTFRYCPECDEKNKEEKPCR